MAMKDVYSTQEMSRILGVSTKSVLVRAAREGWQFRPRPGRGGGKEWLVASMPEATQASIAAAEAKMLAVSETLPEVCSSTPALMKDITPAILDDKRRYKDGKQVATTTGVSKPIWWRCTLIGSANTATRATRRICSSPPIRGERGPGSLPSMAPPSHGSRWSGGN